MFESEEFPGCMETDIAAFVDPRTALQGVRILCAAASFIPESDVEVLQNPDREYKIARMMLGLLESSKEMGNQFPLNINLHQLNGVSFDKGCYIG